MAKELTAGRPVKWYINCAITLAFMLFFRFIPAPEPMTAYGMAVAGIFIGTIYGWCTTNFFFPSLAALFLIGFTQYTTPTGALAKMFSNPQVLQSLFLMLAMAILNATGVTAWVARWIVTRKFLKGRPWLLITMLFVASVVIGLVGNVAGSVMVMWPLVKDIFHEVGYEKGETAPAFVMFGIVVTGMSASMTMPFQIATVSTFAFLFQASDGVITSFNGAAYMGFAIPVLVLCVAGVPLCVPHRRVPLQGLRTGQKRRSRHGLRSEDRLRHVHRAVPPAAGAQLHPRLHPRGRAVQHHGHCGRVHAGGGCVLRTDVPGRAVLRHLQAAA